ncbi:Rne/Rng family ribonuclease [Bacillus sp. SG-1]|uniref:Rne/Rng family ribonuclease n=1 Tax=Bacillus sp. SG-1 TaxID=161544 RepID=UPI0002F88980|nr:Rne/Rng family ribonuclease [Bacillus sp. SG-1]
MNRIIVNALGREKRWARLRDGIMESFHVYQPEKESIAGNIYIGRVDKVEKGLNAAFINIGEGKNGFLHIEDLAEYMLLDEKERKTAEINRLLHQGQKLIVQVKKDPAGTKGPRVTGIIEMKGTSLVYLPHGRYTAVSKKASSEEQKKKWRRFGSRIKEEEEGIVFRTAALGKAEKEIQNEYLGLKKQYQELYSSSLSKKAPFLLHRQDVMKEDILEEIKKVKQAEIITDDYSWKNEFQEFLHNNKASLGGEITHFQSHENIFVHYRVETQIEKAMKKVVWLDNGATIVIEPTEALTVIDVNTGKFTGKSDLSQTVLKTNELAAKEIARQLKIRNLSGIILIDFIEMKSEQHQTEVVNALKEGLKEDGKRTTIVGFTELGILQLTRKKTKPPLLEYISCRCPICSGYGMVESAESMAYKLERELYELYPADEDKVIIEATEDVQKVFKGESSQYLKEMEKSINKKIEFQPVSQSHPFYRIKRLGNL